MAETRHKDVNWALPENFTWSHVPVALLMDLRDELRGIRYAMEAAGRLLHGMHLKQQRIRRYLAGPVRKPKQKRGRR